MLRLPPFQGLVWPVAVLALVPGIAAAGFSFNFSSDPNQVYSGRALAVCNMPGQTNVNCSSFYAQPDSTPFLQERVQDPATGKLYYHVVVGQPGDGFAQEFFITAASAFAAGQNSDGSASFGKDTCGNPRCNGQDPLGASSGDNRITGIGTGGSHLVGGSPLGEVAVLQLMGVHTKDANTGQWNCADSYCGSYQKDWGKKPRLRQIFNGSSGGQTVQWTFDLDLSGQDMLTLPTTATEPVITFSISGAAGGGPASFDYAKDAPQRQSTAGRYCRGTPDASGSCTPPSLPSDWSTVNLNQYSYFDGDMPLDPDWSLYRDPAQN